MYGFDHWQRLDTDEAALLDQHGIEPTEDGLHRFCADKGWRLMIEPIDHRADPYGPEWRAQVYDGRPRIGLPCGEADTREVAAGRAVTEAITYKQRYGHAAR